MQSLELPIMRHELPLWTRCAPMRHSPSLERTPGLSRRRGPALPAIDPQWPTRAETVPGGSPARHLDKHVDLKRIQGMLLAGGPR